MILFEAKHASTLLCSIAFVFTSAPCVAADTVGLGSEFGVLDQIVTSSFEPASLIVLQEVSLGKVRQYQATSVPLEPEMNPPADLAGDAGSRRIIGAAVTLDSDSADDEFHFTFFMASEDSGFAATEIKKWNYQELAENSPTLEILSTQMAELRHRLKIKRVTAIDLEEKLEVLKRKASSIADVDGIIKLKMERTSLENVESAKDLEIERLRALSDTGRNLPEPKNIGVLRAALSDNLREAAKITSMADRLNRRKNKAAEQHFKRKLRLVKEMKNIDPESLAQQILKLRKKRRDYETRLGITSNDLGESEF